MPAPLNIQGVGNGHQVCNYKMICPLAIPHDDGVTRLHKITSPIVEGSGEELPGLLGLKSLEADRAILDTGNRTLIFPGRGNVDWTLPPGSVTVPLHKAPSGHLVMVVDDFERAVTKPGGTPEISLQLQALEVPVPDDEPSSDAIASGRGQSSASSETKVTPASAETIVSEQAGTPSSIEQITFTERYQ